MAYLPPLNGGRINASIGGNTGGTASARAVSTGTVVFAGGNNVTLSQSTNVNGATISFHAPSQAAFSAGISTQGNTGGTIGFASNQLQFVGSNMISLSQGTGAGGNTLTINATQSVQTQSRFNLTLGGNSTSAGGGYAQISSGTMLLAGGNNVTLSQNGNSITISGASQSAQTQSLIQAIAGAGGTASTGTVSFANGNGVSFGMNGQTMTASHNGITSQSNQTLSFSAGSQSALTAAGTMDARSFVLNGVGAASVGFSNSSAFISVPAQSVQTQGLQGAAAAGGTVTSGSVSFANGNGISFGANGQTITASHNGLTSQTNQTLGIYTAGNTLQTNTGTVDARSLTFNGGGIVSVGYSNGSVQISATGGGGGGSVSAGGTNYVAGVSLNPQGAMTISGGTNSTNKTLSISVPAASSLSATGIVNISSNGSTISIGASQSIQTQGVQTVVAGTGTLTSGSLSFANSNGVTFGLSNGTLTASAVGGGGGGSVSAGGTNYVAGVSLNPQGAMTISGGTNSTNKTLSISVPAVSSVSATGLLSVSTNGSTVSMGVGLTSPRWEYPDSLLPLATGGTSMSLQRIFVPSYITGSSAKIAGVLSIGTSTGAATGSGSLSYYLGIYTLSAGSVLNLYTASTGSGSQSTSWQAGTASSASTNGINLVSGLRQFTMPMTVNLTPGDYWVGHIIRTSAAGGASTFSYTPAGNSNYSNGGIPTPLGSNTSIGFGAKWGQGIYNTTALPTTIGITSIVQTGASAVMRAAFYHALYSTGS